MQPAGTVYTSAPTSATIYVSPGGNDSAPGTASAPLKTIQTAVLRARKSDSPSTIFLGAGTYYLDTKNQGQGIVLEPEDSGLTISAEKGEEAILSGGIELSNLHWTPSASNPKVYTTTLTSVQTGLIPPQGVTSLRVNGLRATRARYPNANPEIDLFPKGYVTDETDWAPPVYPPYNTPESRQVCKDSELCGPSKTLTIPVQGSEWHGMYQNFTVGYGGACSVYDPPVSPWCSQDFYLCRQFSGGGAMHTRMPSGINATTHLPNSPYKHPEGAHIFAWRPGHWYTWMFEVGKSTSAGPPVPAVDHWTLHENTNAAWGQITGGPGTSTPDCKYLGSFDTLNGCWAACNASACKEFVYKPFGVKDNGCYSMTSGKAPLRTGPGCAHVVTGVGPQPAHAGPQTFLFTGGGNQGGEGNDKAGEWYIENVFEELDAENEYFFDRATSKLYLWFNGTGVPPSTVVVPTLADMIVVNGTKEQPVKNISIVGLQLRDNRPTYMEPRTNPSGGDWALERQGAILVQGCEGCIIAGNFFHHLDSNAVMLSGYNRDTIVRNNEFVWLGQNAIASWGYLDGETQSTMTNSGLGGLQPRGTLVEGNWVHEIGHIQKQSSL